MINDLFKLLGQEAALFEGYVRRTVIKGKNHFMLTDKGIKFMSKK